MTLVVAASAFAGAVSAEALWLVARSLCRAAARADERLAEFDLDPSGSLPDNVVPLHNARQLPPTFNRSGTRE